MSVDYSTVKSGSACNADSYNTEASIPFQKSHYSKAQKPSCQTIQNAEQISKNKTRQYHPCYG